MNCEHAWEYEYRFKDEYPIGKRCINCNEKESFVTETPKHLTDYMFTPKEHVDYTLGKSYNVRTERGWCVCWLDENGVFQTNNQDYLFELILEVR